MNAYTDSQETLVNVFPPTLLTFSRDSFSNTVVYQDSVPSYTISSQSTSRSFMTTITNVKTEKIVSIIERRRMGSDTIAMPKFRDGKPVKLSQWLAKSKDYDGQRLSTLRIQGIPGADVSRTRAVSWKRDFEGLVLYDAGEPVVQAFAHPTSSHKVSSRQVVIDSTMLFYLDEILTSWLIEERRTREKEHLAR